MRVDSYIMMASPQKREKLASIMVNCSRLLGAPVSGSPVTGSVRGCRSAPKSRHCRLRAVADGSELAWPTLAEGDEGAEGRDEEGWTVQFVHGRGLIAEGELCALLDCGLGGRLGFVGSCLGIAPPEHTEPNGRRFVLPR